MTTNDREAAIRSFIFGHCKQDRHDYCSGHFAGGRALCACDCHVERAIEQAERRAEGAS